MTVPELPDNSADGSVPIRPSKSFEFRDACFISSQDVWMALNEVSDGLLGEHPNLETVEVDPKPLLLNECEQFLDQLFYWVMLRSSERSQTRLSLKLKSARSKDPQFDRKNRQIRRDN